MKFLSHGHGIMVRTPFVTNYLNWCQIRHMPGYTRFVTELKIWIVHGWQYQNTFMYYHPGVQYLCWLPESAECIYFHVGFVVGMHFYTQTVKVPTTYLYYSGTFLHFFSNIFFFNVFSPFSGTFSPSVSERKSTLFPFL